MIFYTFSYVFLFLQLKDPSETPFVSTSVSYSSFARLPAQVESFIENLPPHNEHNLAGHNDQTNVMTVVFNSISIFVSCNKLCTLTFCYVFFVYGLHDQVRSQVRDICSKFHRDIMAASVSAIQPVVSRQLCCMAEMMWNNHAVGPSVHMDSHGAAATPVHLGSEVPEAESSCRRRRPMHTTPAPSPVQMDMEVPEGVTTRSRTKAINTETDVDMSSATRNGKKQLHAGMPSGTTKTVSRSLGTNDSRKRTTEAMKFHDSIKHPIQNARKALKQRRHTKNDLQSYEEGAEKETDMELDTGQDKSPDGGDTPTGQVSSSIPENINDDVAPLMNKSLDGGTDTVAEPSFSTQSDAHDDFEADVGNVKAPEDAAHHTLGQDKSSSGRGTHVGQSSPIILEIVMDGGNQSNEIPTDEKLGMEVDTRQEKGTGGGGVGIPIGQPSSSIPENVIDATGLENKSIGGGDNTVVEPSLNTPKDIHDDVELGIGDVKVAEYGGQHALNTTGRTSTSDSTSLGTINCAQQFSYTTPNSASVADTDRRLSTYVYRRHIKADVKRNTHFGSAYRGMHNSLSIFHFKFCTVPHPLPPTSSVVRTPYLCILYII